MCRCNAGTWSLWEWTIDLQITKPLEPTCVRTYVRTCVHTSSKQFSTSLLLNCITSHGRTHVDIVMYFRFWCESIKWLIHCMCCCECVHTSQICLSHAGTREPNLSHDCASGVALAYFTYIHLMGLCSLWCVCGEGGHSRGEHLNPRLSGLNWQSLQPQDCLCDGFKAKSGLW